MLQAAVGTRHAESAPRKAWILYHCIGREAALLEAAEEDAICAPALAMRGALLRAAQVPGESGRQEQHARGHRASSRSPDHTATGSEQCFPSSKPGNWARLIQTGNSHLALAPLTRA